MDKFQKLAISSLTALIIFNFNPKDSLTTIVEPKAEIVEWGFPLDCLKGGSHGEVVYGLTRARDCDGGCFSRDSRYRLRLLPDQKPSKEDYEDIKRTYLFSPIKTINNQTILLIKYNSPN